MAALGRMARRSAGALAGLWLSVAVQAASAAGLVEVWQAAAQNDAEHAVARAAQATAQPRRDQAAALWRPNVGLAASVGVASLESESRGAQFSAPGLGSSSGVGFSTSVNDGSAGRWSVTASQPLYNPERRAQQRQLGLAAEIADLEWLAAGQTLMLRTAERYFDLALAEEALRVLTLQLGAVQRATAEVQDRFKLGDVPVTDTHEAVARLAAIRAQVLAAHSDLQIKRNLLADSTGLPEATLVARLPAGGLAGPAPRALQAWLDDARAGNPGNRIALLGAELARQEAAKYSRRGAPTLDLVAQAGRDRLSGSGDYGSASNTASQRMIGLQLTLPLYAGDYREAKQDEALRLADKAAAEAECSRQQVAQQVRAAWLASSVGAERVQALAEALQASEARLDATRLGQTVGDRTTLDRLNAENDAAAARLALAQGRVGLLLSRLRLAALAGQIDEAALLTVDRELVAASP